MIINNKVKILMFSGPSGGHLFPAQSLAETIREKWPNAQIDLVTSKRAQYLCSKFPQKIFDSVQYLPEFGSPAGLSFSALKILFRIPVALAQSWQILARTKPDICVGFGSFVSFFGMLFAAWQKIPTVIHEQNQVPGKATRMLCSTVNKIATSFPETSIPVDSAKVVFTGLPIRKFLRVHALSLKQKTAKGFTLLVCGGSQGSAFLNSLVVKTFSSFTTAEREQFAVIHITGSGQEHAVKAGYQELGLRAEVYSFLEEMQLVYNRADAAVSRAGANSSFEQALFGIPTVFIPYPLADAHQEWNARYFVQNGGAVSYAQNDEAVKSVSAQLKSWMLRDSAYHRMSRAMLNVAQNDGHELLFRVVEKELERKQNDKLELSENI